jgi:hypothetical protein
MQFSSKQIVKKLVFSTKRPVHWAHTDGRLLAGVGIHFGMGTSYFGLHPD